MAQKHMRDGEDFFDVEKGGDHFDSMKGFGFSNSIEGYEKHQPAPPFAEDSPTHGSGMEEKYAHGGETHIHPHGHHIVRVEQHADGSVTHHHAHGGHSVHHADGHVTHHAHGGAMIPHHAMGGEHPHAHPHGHHTMHTEHRDGMMIEHHDHGGRTVHHHDGNVEHYGKDGASLMHGGMHMFGEGHHGMSEMAGAARKDGFENQSGLNPHEEAPGKARGGRFRDGAKEKGIAAKAIHQHEDHEHHGEHTDLKLAGGGMPRLPRGMRPKAAHLRPLGEESALNRPPRNPNMSRTPKNIMPGGGMGYGMQPSTEKGGIGMGNDEELPAPGPTPMRRGGGVHK